MQLNQARTRCSGTCRRAAGACAGGMIRSSCRRRPRSRLRQAGGVVGGWMGKLGASGVVRDALCSGQVAELHNSGCQSQPDHNTTHSRGRSTWRPSGPSSSAGCTAARAAPSVAGGGRRLGGGCGRAAGRGTWHTGAEPAGRAATACSAHLGILGLRKAHGAGCFCGAGTRARGRRGTGLRQAAGGEAAVAAVGRALGRGGGGELLDVTVRTLPSDSRAPGQREEPQAKGANGCSWSLVLATIAL